MSRNGDIADKSYKPCRKIDVNFYKAMSLKDTKGQIKATYQGYSLDSSEVSTGDLTIVGTIVL